MDQSNTIFKVKNQQDSQTQDASSFSNLNQSSSNIFIDELHLKFINMWGRIFIFKMKEYNRRKLKDRGNLALILAQRMPPNIKDQVTKIVRYYEEHMEDQIHEIHNLVEKNHKLQQQLDNVQFNKQNVPKYVQNVDNKNQRISQLENCVIDKNKQIINLNKEITDLITKVKKYKKRLYELQSKSPVKQIYQQQ